MKIVEQTPSKLTLLERPIFDWLLGGIFLIIGLFVSLIVLLELPNIGMSTITCQQVVPSQVSCEIAKSTLFGPKVRKIPSNQLQEAKIVELFEGAKDYQLVLFTDKGKIPLDDYLYSEASYHYGEAVAARINSYLNKPEETLLKIEPNYLDDIFTDFMAVFFGFSFTLAGFLLCQQSVLILDQSLDCMVLKRRRLLGTKVSEYTLHEVTSARVESDDSGKSRYGLFVVLTSGERIIVSNGYSNLDRPAKREAATTMCKFLKMCKKAKAKQGSVVGSSGNPKTPEMNF